MLQYGAVQSLLILPIWYGTVQYRYYRYVVIVIYFYEYGQLLVLYPDGTSTESTFN